MIEVNPLALSSRGLALLAFLIVPLGCYSSSSTGGAGGNASGAGGDTTAGNTGGGGGGGSVPGLGGRTGTLRITLLGDSTTSDGCFRAHLWQNLTQAGHTQFDFIGTRKGNPGCTIAGFDQDNEGHGGYIVVDVLKATSTGRPGGADSSDPYVSSAQDLVTWFDGHPTDVVLMNFGTNDISNSKPTAMILDAYAAILTRLRANNPNVRLMVAQLPPITWIYCPVGGCGPRVQELNDAIPGWAASQSMPESPVSAVDLFTGYDGATDTVDGVHANDSGSVKIANAWYDAIAPLF
jgi:acyl-CoA thioesterase-1